MECRISRIVLCCRLLFWPCTTWIGTAHVQISVKTTSFVRLYLDVKALGGVQLQDDDISLSSIEDEEEGDDDEEEENDEENNDYDADNPEENNGSKTPVAEHEVPPVDDPGNDNIVDLTASPCSSPCRVARSAISCNSNGNRNESDSGGEQQQNNKLKRLACLAKKFKRQFQQKNAQYKAQYTEKRKISQRVRQVEGDLAKMKESMATLERDNNSSRLQLREKELSYMRVRSECEVLRGQYSMIEKEKSRVDAQLKANQLQYQKELEKARTQSMSEVQQVLNEHPKVVAENRYLKEELQRLQRMQAPRVTSSSNRNSNGSSSSGSRKLNPKDITKALREMDNQIRSGQGALPPPTSKSPTSRKRDIHNMLGGRESLKNPPSNAKNLQKSSAVTINGQYSSQASRMVKARGVAKRSSQSAIVTDMLSGPDPPSKKQSTLSNTSSGKKKQSSLLKISSQNNRLKAFSASRRDLFQRKP